jgi:hypothetical protein
VWGACDEAVVEKQMRVVDDEGARVPCRDAMLGSPSLLVPVRYPAESRQSTELFTSQLTSG